jgi:hypothetical protein
VGGGGGASVYQVIKSQVPSNEGNFLTNLATISFSRWTLLHGVCKFGHIFYNPQGDVNSSGFKPIFLVSD